MHCLGVNHGIVPLQVLFHSTRSKCSVNQMQFILGIVCHLGGVTLYVALIMDCQRKTIKKVFQCTLGGYMKRLPFLEVLVKVSFQYHLPIKSYGDFNVTDLTT